MFVRVLLYLNIIGGCLFGITVGGSCREAKLCCPGRDSSCVVQKAPINAIIEDLSDKPCYCDHACLKLGDCCSDFKEACGGESKKFSALFLPVQPCQVLQKNFHLLLYFCLNFKHSSQNINLIVFWKSTLKNFKNMYHIQQNQWMTRISILHLKINLLTLLIRIFF